MSFLTTLGKIVNEQVGVGENSTTSLDSNGIPLGLLGDFANKIDQTAQRTYIEDGFIRNVRPRMREIIWQQPDMAVIIKKRMFTSLAENFKLDNLETDEKLFIRASKRLFQNKCKVIAAYERLTKIENMAKDSGYLNSYMFPALVTGITDMQSAGILGKIMSEETQAAFEKLRKVLVFSNPTSVTTWLVDNETPFMSELGEGAGTIELTLVHNLSSKIGTKFGSGSASFTVEDPYKMMVITNDDIDMAIADATNWFKNGSFGRFTEIETRKLIEDQKRELNALRALRGAANIKFVMSPVTIVSKKLRVLLENGFFGEEEQQTPELVFTYDPGFAGIGSDVDIDPMAFTGKQGLNNAEADVFKRVVRNIYLLLAYEQDTRSNAISYNKSTNYVRRKMYLHFGGKHLIQPMDVVNVFITSKTMNDDKLTKGFENQSRGMNFGNKLNSLVRNINTSLANLSGSSDSQKSPDEQEKNEIAGVDFPMWLWRLYRNDFTKQGAGTSTFVGLVKSVTHNYDNGKYTMSVSCEDNASYFTKSQINIKPSVDVYNSNLYDPLTPFKVSFDGATGDVLTDVQSGHFPELLQENEILLQSELVRFHNGRFRGSRVDKNLYKSQDAEPYSNRFRNVLSDPLGFVYKWKEGIGTLTNRSRPHKLSSTNRETSVNISANPFAGQDVMNVLSLLITGQPYNYNTFLKSAIDAGNALVDGDPTENRGAAITYIQSLAQDLSKRNAIWGNFVPFKKQNLSREADKFIKAGLSDFITKQDSLLALITERAGLNDQLALTQQSYATAPEIVGKNGGRQFIVPKILEERGLAETLRRKMEALDIQIQAAKTAFSNSVSENLTAKTNGSITIIGDSIELSPSYSSAQSSASEEQRNLDDEEFKKRLNIVTQRRLWKVKANEDTNLFIVDDQYDKSFDIQAFEKKLAGKFDLFKSEYTTIDIQIKQVAELLGLEIFADSQGHIQARPPLYNKIPSSVFHRMFRDKERNGVQVFPQFLESLLFNQLQSQIGRIEIIEDEIRIRVLALGVVPTNSTDPDKTIELFLRGSQVPNTDGAFKFVSGYRTGKVGGGDNDFRKFISQTKPDNMEDFVKFSLNPVSEGFNKAASANILYDVVARSESLNKVKFDNSAVNSAATQTQSRISIISKRLANEKGVQAPTIRELFSNSRFTAQGQISQLDSIKVTNEIAVFISERQKILPIVSGTIKNLTEGIQLNDEKKGATAALFPSLNRNASIPSILQHMIEHEDNDDLGPGSGKRFVIKESQIISISFNENAPPFSAVEVKGLVGDGFITPGENLGLGSGNQIASASAVDYDMWRMYGFKTASTVEAPFFSDPDTQCAPYAVHLLNLARRDVINATAKLVGNEFYQVGDVVYIEDRDLLFYVSGVDQNISYSSSFVTTLSLNYGHKPGEYIPTILDIVGRFLYKTKEYSGYFRSNRFDISSGDQEVSTVIFNHNGNASGGALDALLSGNVGKRNQKAMTQMLFATTGALNPAGFIRTRPILQLRIYTKDGVVDPLLEWAAKAVAEWLQNPQQPASNQTLITIGKQNEGINIPKLNNVFVTIVDMSKEPDKTPSASAWNCVKSIVEGDPGALSKIRRLNEGGAERNIRADEFTKPADIYDNVMISNIIDAWITFEDVEESISASPGGQTSQASIAKDKEMAVSAANFAHAGRPEVVE